VMPARDVVAQLGGRWHGSYGTCSCPVHDDRRPSLKIRDWPESPDGISVHCFSGCDWRTVKAELARQGLIGGWSRDSAERPAIDPAELERRAAEQRAETAKRRELARWIWGKARPGGAELVRYLRDCRAIDLDRIGGVPDCLRFERAARIPGTEQHCPAMVAAVTDALGEVTAVHTTYLNADCSDKAPMDDARVIIGPLGGGAVRLFPVRSELGIAEGIETALAAAELTGVPTWAGLNTSGLQGFMAPPKIRRVIIFADNDRPNPKTGKRPGTYAAETLAARLTQQRIDAEIRYPAGGRKDFNDQLRERRASAHHSKKEAI
jgi:putative DNA primase/helicase